jgi:hypothetical protein
VTSPRRFTELAAVAAAALFLASWGVLHTGSYDENEIVDIPVYLSYGNAIEDGAVPYRDIRPEYPPGALPAFVLPALVSDDERGYRDAFEWLMAACGAALVLLTGVALAGCAPRERARSRCSRSSPASRSCSAPSCSPASTSGPRCSSRAHLPRSSTDASGSASACSALRSP